MVDPIASAGSMPPIIRFKPDPGEPAVDVTASPRQTAYLVTAQEQRNETRLRNRAILRGEEVLYSHRAFSQTYQDGAVVYTGGLTTVVSRQRQANPIREWAGRLQEAAAQQNTPPDEPPGEQETDRLDDRQASIASTKETEQDLAQKERELNLQHDQVELWKERTKADLKEAAEEGDAARMRSAERKVDELERREHAIEREERKVELERFRQRLEDAQQTISKALLDNAGQPAKIIGLLHDGRPTEQPPLGKRLDLLA